MESSMRKYFDVNGATIYIYKHKVLCIREFLKFNFLMEMWKYLNYV